MSNNKGNINNDEKNTSYLIEETKFVLNKLLVELDNSLVDNKTLKEFSDFCKDYSLEVRELIYKNEE